MNYFGSRVCLNLENDAGERRPFGFVAALVRLNLVIPAGMDASVCVL